MEIRSLSREIFLNHYNQELFEEYREWIPFIVDIYAPLRDSETGDFRSFPFEGSLMDQPYQTMLILKEIQSEYRQVVKEQNEARLRNVKGQ
jgi:hypothetical protein